MFTLATTSLTGPAQTAAESAAQATESIGTPALWIATIAGVVALFVIDFLITRKPHDPSMREAVGWSAFYIAIPLAFGVYLWSQYGSPQGIEYYTGYLVEKSLSVDNLFVFIILLSAFAVPRELRQRVLLIGVAGALVLRGIFIALGAQMIASFSWTFLLFGAILLVTAIKVGRDALSDDDHTIDVGSIRSVKFIKRFYPSPTATRARDSASRGTASAGSPRSPSSPSPSSAPTSSSRSTPCPPSTASPATPISSSPPMPSPCSACARSTSCSRTLLSSLVHLGHGLALILGFIGVKLVLHWGHTVWRRCPRSRRWPRWVSSSASSWSSP